MDSTDIPHQFGNSSEAAEPSQNVIAPHPTAVTVGGPRQQNEAIPSPQKDDDSLVSASQTQRWTQIHLWEKPQESVGSRWTGPQQLVYRSFGPESMEGVDQER